MTLENTLRQQLNSTEPGGIHFQDAGWDVTLALDKRDSLSCSIKELTLTRAEPCADVRAWATRLADRVTGLLEPLRVLEVDARLQKAILRSDVPSQRDGKACYYELTLTPTAASLKRFAGDRVNGEPRQVIAFVLTHDAIVKVVGDIVSG
jgi:hypothetical protein